MRKIAELLKQGIRLVEAATTPARRRLVLRGRGIETVRSLWWSRCGRLAFHTHGAISAVRPVAEHLAGQVFAETVKVVTLDAWRAETGVGPIDVIKMDIEGAEIEAIEGAREVLTDDRPELLVQAYHLRGGVRTFESCRTFLEGLKYSCREAAPGLLNATARS